MDPPIYSLPSEFSDTILSENIQRADHEEKIVKIGRKSHDTGAYTDDFQLFGNGKHTSHAHTLTASSEAVEREKS